MNDNASYTGIGSSLPAVRSIQVDNLTLNGVTVNDLVISAVDTSRSVILIAGQLTDATASTQGLNARDVLVFFLNSTTVRGQRNSNAGAVTLRVQIIEFR